MARSMLDWSCRFSPSLLRRLWLGWGLAALALAAVIAGSILTGLLCFQRRPLLSAEGVLYAGLPVVALIWLREDQPNGFAAVLLILIAVVATDVAAFVFGRLIGGPKLAPAISPNKTWSGFLGGISTAGLAAAGFAHTIGADPLMVGISGVFLGIVAQIGDLTEVSLEAEFRGERFRPHHPWPWRYHGPHRWTGFRLGGRGFRGSGP